MTAQSQIHDILSRERPDYTALFGSAELCECEHCRSVHSPAAYLVDLLQFIGPDIAAVTPLDLLIGNPAKTLADGSPIRPRRPDIAHIQLSCENTNTEIPYIDLVNEVLESQIAFGQTLPLETGAGGAVIVPHVGRPNESSPGISAAELAASPEHVQDSAYAALEAACFPFSLPFNQPLASLRLTLKALESSRAEVMRVFDREKDPASATAADVEMFEMSEREFSMLTGKAFDGTAAAVPGLAECFGLSEAAPPPETSWVSGGLPAGATSHADGDVWGFAAGPAPPPSGAQVHSSAAAPGMHQHYFKDVAAAAQIAVGAEDLLFAEILIDPANPPSMVMLQFHTNGWLHRAYWGENKVDWGIDGTASRRYMGPIPAAGAWARLEVPPGHVGLVGERLSGMAFTLFDGGASWGSAGLRQGNWIEKLGRVPTLLNRTGISYVELTDLLRTRYVNPDLPRGAKLAAFDRVPISFSALASLVASGFTNPDSKTLASLAGAGTTLAELKAWADSEFATISAMLVLDAPDSSCDLALTRLRRLDGGLPSEKNLSRLHRFIRLRARTGWSIQDLDRALTALQAGDIDSALLRQLGQIRRLEQELDLPVQKILSFFGTLPVDGEAALYHQLFLGKGVRKADPVFAPVDGTYLAGGAVIAGHEPALLAAARLRDSDLAPLRAHLHWTGAGGASLPLSDPSAPLTLATATAIYRHGLLSRALKVAVADLIRLEKLAGIRPFSSLSADNAAFDKSDMDPARTLDFIALAKRVKESGLEPARLDYLFGGTVEVASALAPSEPVLAAQLESLRSGLIEINKQHQAVDDPLGEVTRASLSALFEPEVADAITRLIGGSAVYSAALAGLPAGIAFPAPAPDMAPGTTAYSVETRRLSHGGWLSDTDKAALLGLSGDSAFQAAVTLLHEAPRKLIGSTLVATLGWKSAIEDLRGELLETPLLDGEGRVDPAKSGARFTAFLARLAPYLRAHLGRSLVRDRLASALEIAPAAMALLLEGASGQVILGCDGDSTAPAILDFLGLVGDGLAASYFADKTLSAPAQRSGVDQRLAFRWDPEEEFGARWSGTLIAEQTQPYQIYVHAGGGARLSVNGEEAKRWTDGPPDMLVVEQVLEAGVDCPITIEYFNEGSGAAGDEPALLELRWGAPATPIEIVPTHRLYSGSAAAAAAAARNSWLRAHKAAEMIKAAELSTAEIALLFDPSRASGFDLNGLPTVAPAANAQALCAQWTRVDDYRRLREGASQPDRLPEALAAEKVDEAITILSEALGDDSGRLGLLAGQDGFDLKAADFGDPSKLNDLAHAMKLLGRIGAPPVEMFAFASPSPSLDEAGKMADDAARAHRAGFDEKGWLEVAPSVTDPLREAQRSALVAYLLPRLGYAHPEQLFEHFLIDAEMCACMRTSRIKQAISSVQLYIQRCRLSLELPNVAPAMIDDAAWEWMQSYRVWEANLKVFLYPENWIEPELRDDKSVFFRELEAELLQSELTALSAETALGNYLEKLDTVSHLEICGVYEQEDFSASEKIQRIVHVFGRTFAAPRTYFYRKLVTANANSEQWTPWERVPLDIQAEEVSPMVWNRRLYLFWPIVTEKTDTSGNSVNNYSIGWSEYRQGRWSAKRVTPISKGVNVDGTVRMDLKVHYDALEFRFLTEPKPVGMSQPVGPLGSQGPTYVAFADHLGTIDLRTYSGVVETTHVDKSIKYTLGFLPFSAGDTATLESNGLEFLPVSDPDSAIPVFKDTPGTIHFYARGPKPYTLNDIFFVQEGPRTYMVLPTSSAPSEIGPYFNGGIVPYQAGLIDKVSSVVLAKTEPPKFETKLSKLSAVANPWQSGKAALALAEVATVKTASPTASFSKAELSPAAQVFDFGVIEATKYLLPTYPAEMRFVTFFHPYSSEFQRRLARFGVGGLLTLASQSKSGLPGIPTFAQAYVPYSATVKDPWPVHDVDFSFSGAYSLYNWELFFHIPLLIACRLTQEQRFEEAMRWFHFIFNPTATSADPVPDRYWNVLPFRGGQPKRLDALLKALHAGDKDALAQWQDLQANPFMPHRVARLRLAAYQKNVVMKYFDNLIAWADHLYRQETIEKINQAIQLYALVAILLGRAPERVPPRSSTRPRSFLELRGAKLDDLNGVLVDFENDLPFSNWSTSTAPAPATRALMGIGRSFYFCIPGNEKLLSYWRTIGERLFNIRHCLNIEGAALKMPLFEPPIDPALLVKAAAQGLRLDSVLSDRGARLPSYRFVTLLAKALEMAGELRSLGSTLLSALEKQDAEKIALMRSSQEGELLALVKEVKRQQLAEAREAETALRKSRDVVQARLDHYSGLAQRLAEELSRLSELDEAQRYQDQSGQNDLTAAELTAALPDIAIGIGAGMSGVQPTFNATMGRGNVVAIYQAMSRSKSIKAALHGHWSAKAEIVGGWKRRDEDWKLQRVLASKELVQVDKQILAASIRTALAEQELASVERQIEHSAEVQDHLRNKFTAVELYGWMVSGISATYFQAYQLAYDLAKKAELCFRFERGVTSSNYVQFGAWEGLRKGLLCGERLHLQLKQLETAYLDGNRREFELTKAFSLALNDPLALLELKERGSCEIELPEWAFDLDYPGHYKRRIKSVSLSLLAVLGPYLGVNCTLTLLRDKTRIRSDSASYREREEEEDERFVMNWAPMQAIATSSGNNDSGLFDFTFRDERYLPFEGAGAVSRWRIELNDRFRLFDYDTISDCVLHVKYTALPGGTALRQAAIADLEKRLADEEGRLQTQLFSLRNEFPNEWHRLKNVADGNGDHEQGFSLDKRRFPGLFSSAEITIAAVELFGVPEPRLDDGVAPELELSLTSAGGGAVALQPAKALGALVHKQEENLALSVDHVDPGSQDADWTIKVDKADVAKSLERLRDIVLVLHYTVKMPKD